MCLVYQEYSTKGASGFDLFLKTKLYKNNTDNKAELFIEKYKEHASFLKANTVPFKDNFGYWNSKLFFDLRHKIDDSTLHHIYTGYL